MNPIDRPIQTPSPAPRPCGLAAKSAAFAKLGAAAFAGAVVCVCLSGSRAGPMVAVVGPILGVVIWPLLSLAAVVCGLVARVRIRRAAGALSGRGQAVFGMWAGASQLLLVAALIAIPNMGSRPTAARNACIANLKLIDAAKEQWALENKKPRGAEVDSRALNSYLKSSQVPVCPRGGKYSYNAVGTDPTCSLGDGVGHTLKFELAPSGPGR